MSGWSRDSFADPIVRAKDLAAVEWAGLAEFRLDDWKQDAEQTYFVLPADGRGPFGCWRYVLAVDRQPAAACAYLVQMGGTGGTGSRPFLYPRRFQLTRHNSVNVKFDKLFCLASYGIPGDVLELESFDKGKSE